jgi:hypothetical protein
MKEEKNCLFQYATRGKVIEDTDLITLEEAKSLWNKYLPEIKKNWDDSSSPEMCIWTDCVSNTDYHTQGFDIDFRDCELQNGEFYRIKKDRIKVD